MDSWCLICPRTVSPDLEHINCSCILVRTAWLYVRALVYRQQSELRDVEDGILVRFLFPKKNSDQELSFLDKLFDQHL